MTKDLRISPTLNRRQSIESRRQMQALRENMMVLVRCLGLVSLANTTPTINACRITPVMLCMHMISTASGHASVVYLWGWRNAKFAVIIFFILFMAVPHQNSLILCYDTTLISLSIYQKSLPLSVFSVWTVILVCIVL